ncbi:MAG: flagellar basal body-associated FliL family protein [Leptospiraceae bacterium]|nr:flagellar basal body-associated FliL family protein [Leptospiraceae bacterium]
MALFLKIIGLLFGIILIIILFFFYTSIQTAKKVATSIEETHKKDKKQSALERFNFPTKFNIVTADDDKTHYIKFNLSFGIEKNQSALKDELTARRPQFENIINLIVSKKKINELKTTVSQMELEEEIKAHANHILKSEKVIEVYISEFSAK